MELETFRGWTIDRRLNQLRKIKKDGSILFIDFDSQFGQLFFELKLIEAERLYLLAELEKLEETL